MFSSPALPASSAPGVATMSRAAPAVSDIVAMIRQRFWLIVGCGLLAAIATAAAGSMVRPTFKATAQLLVDPRDLKLLENQVTPSADAQTIGITLVESQAMVLGSDNVLGQVVAKLGLAADPEFNGTQAGILASLTAPLKTLAARFLPASFSRAQSDEAAEAKAAALTKLQRVVKIRRVDRTYVLEVSAAAQSRDTAKRILTTMIEGYIEDQTHARADVARRAGEDLDAGIAKLRENVDTWERKVAQHRADNNLVGARGVMVSEQQLSDINAQLITARVDAARLEAKLDATPKKASDYDQVPEAVASQPLRDLRAALARITQQKAALATQLLPNHPTMRGVVDNERQVLALIGAELVRIRRSITIEYQRAKGNEAALDAQLSELRTVMNASANAQIPLREYERELEVGRTIYRQAITRAREAREQINLNTTNVRVISTASSDPARSFPPPLTFLAGFGFLVGTILSLLVLHVRQLARNVC